MMKKGKIGICGKTLDHPRFPSSRLVIWLRGRRDDMDYLELF